MILLTGRSDGYAQLITVLIIFVLVLGVTALTTKWIADYQKQQGANCNVEIIETTRISNNKYIQIVRVGESYMVLALCKDTVTMLGEVPKEQLKGLQSAGADAQQRGKSFKELLERTIKKDSSNDSEPKD